MNREFHELTVSTFVQATESEEKVKESAMNLFMDVDVPLVERNELEGVNGNRIISLKYATKKHKQILALLHLWKDLPFWSDAMGQLSDRLDDGNNFHVRIDKESAFEDNFFLWKGGESINIILKIATFPSSREKAMDILKKVSR